MRLTASLLVFLVAVSLAGVRAASAEPDASAGRTPTFTRLVHLFMEIETRLAESVNKRDTAAVTSMLGEDFEMRVGSMPGNPIPRDAWIRQSLEGSPSTFRIEQMAVHDFGKLAVVSYLRKESTAKAGAPQNIFVVDLWAQGPQGPDDWKLAVRYAGSAEKNVSAMPGAPMGGPVFEKRE